MNGHLKITDDLEENNDSRETCIGTNGSSPIDNHQHVEEIEDGSDEPSAIEPPKRGRGRPKGSTTHRSITPTKRYKLRSNDQKGASRSEAIELLSDEDTETHKSMYALLASEISFSQAISGSDAVEWKDAIYNEMKSLVAHGNS